MEMQSDCKLQTNRLYQDSWRLDGQDFKLRLHQTKFCTFTFISFCKVLLESSSSCKQIQLFLSQHQTEGWRLKGWYLQKIISSVKYGSMTKPNSRTFVTNGIKLFYQTDMSSFVEALDPENRKAWGTLIYSNKGKNCFGKGELTMTKKKKKVWTSMKIRRILNMTKQSCIVNNPINWFLIDFDMSHKNLINENTFSSLQTLNTVVPLCTFYIF